MKENKDVTYLSKEVFEVHISYTKDALEDLKKGSSLIFHKIEQHEKTLVRNTLSLEEHKKRSLHIEERQDSVLEFIAEVRETMVRLVTTIEHIDKRVGEIESEIKPIQAHIVEVKKLTNFLNIIYENKILIVKLLVFVIVVVFGTYLGVENFSDILKVLK
jgi:chromosome segregation ATPase